MSTFTKTKIVMAVLGTIATLGVASLANANPMLVVVDSTGTQVLNYPTSSYAQLPPSGPIPGGPGPQGAIQVGTDEVPPAYPNNIPSGLNGYAGNYLELVDSSVALGTMENVTFTAMGHGDASQNNEFIVNGGLIDWTISSVTPGVTQASASVAVGSLINFLFNSPGVTPPLGGSNPTINDGIHNPMPQGTSPTAGPGTPGFALFNDNQSGDLTQGTNFWIGLSDGGTPNGPNPGDADFQDFVIKASVPEPGTTLLLAAGLLGLAYGRRRLLS